MCPKFSWCKSVEGRVADIITNQGSWFESYLGYIFSNTIDVVIEVGLRLRLATFLFILMKVFSIFFVKLGSQIFQSIHPCLHTLGNNM